MCPRREAGFNLLVVLLVIVLAIGGGVFWKLNAKWQREAAIEEASTAILLQIADQVRLLGRWNDALSLAGSTPRVALSGPVAKLQDLKREAEKQRVSGCLVEPTVELVGAMDLIIAGFLDFMANTPGADLRGEERSLLIDAKLAKYRAALKDCPPPSPA